MPALAYQLAERAKAYGIANAATLSSLPGPEPTKKMAIVCCMDARLKPEEMFGLELGEAHIIRVGGGRAPDAVRSLIASEHVLGTTEIMIVHHTDCGFSRASSDKEAQDHISEALGGAPTQFLPVMTIQNLTESVQHDMRFLKELPYIRPGATITGWIYDTHKGTIDEVTDSATQRVGSAVRAAGSVLKA